MTVQELLEKLEFEPLSKFSDRNIEGVFISDMVSDVMTAAKSGNLWLTIQTHKSIIPAANMADVGAVIITCGKDVPQETVELASKFEIALLRSELQTFELAIKLHALGLGS
ncbi:MAG: hypothetical protein JEZ06_04210 [Anaerolineaceae bacterium]|nr:hypothetical protein [Anaerolineaceae bacterium]